MSPLFDRQDYKYSIQHRWRPTANRRWRDDAMTRWRDDATRPRIARIKHELHEEKFYFLFGHSEIWAQSLSRSDAAAATKTILINNINIPTEEGSQNKWWTACLSSEISRLINIVREFQFARTFCLLFGPSKSRSPKGVLLSLDFLVTFVSRQK